jgi:hypothetical protein
MKILRNLSNSFLRSKIISPTSIDRRSEQTLRLHANRQRRNIHTWPTLILSVAASTFICELVHSQDQYRGLDAQRGAVMGNSSNGSNNSRSYGPSAGVNSSSGLQAERARFDAAIIEWDRRCEGHSTNSPEGPQCKQDGDRLDAWRASLAARFEAARRAKTGSTTRNVSGTRKSNPNLQSAEKGTKGTNNGAGDQLKAAAKEARRGDQSDLRKNYDEGGAQGDGSLVDGRGSSSQRDQISRVPDKYQSNPEIMRYDTQAREAAAKADKLQQEITKLEQQRNSSANHGQLDVQIVKERNELSAAKSTERAAEINKKEKIHFEEGKMH